jgi:hypothetical protein
VLKQARIAFLWEHDLEGISAKLLLEARQENATFCRESKNPRWAECANIRISQFKVNTGSEIRSGRAAGSGELERVKSE